MSIYNSFFFHFEYSAENAKEFLEGVYMKNHNKLVFTDGFTLGMRSDYNGILLLDTILQSTIEKPYELVEIELPLFEVRHVFVSISLYRVVIDIHESSSES